MSSLCTTTPNLLQAPIFQHRYVEWWLYSSTLTPESGGSSEALGVPGADSDGLDLDENLAGARDWDGPLLHAVVL